MRPWTYSHYKQNTKPLNMEEPFDFFLYRPIAYVVVRLTYFLPLTPNSISGLAFLMALMSAKNLLHFGQNGYFAAGVYLFAFSVLDCCDGMLARMKKNGHPYGEFIDMIVDVLSTIAIFLCLFISLENQIWDKLLLVLSFISLFIHVSVYNFVKEQISQRAHNRKWNKTGLFSNILETVHSTFYRLQLLLENKLDRSNSLLSYGFLAGSTHLSILTIALLCNALSLYYFYAIICANLSLLFLFRQKQGRILT